MFPVGAIHESPANNRKTKTGLLIRMFPVGAIHESPANNRKTKTGDQWSPLQTNFGRDIVFSADFCYNGTNEKPLPLGEVAA
jgi:hypothetical protein